MQHLQQRFLTAGYVDRLRVERHGSERASGDDQPPYPSDDDYHPASRCALSPIPSIDGSGKFDQCERERCPDCGTPRPASEPRCARCGSDLPTRVS